MSLFFAMYPYWIEWLLSGHWMYVARLTVYQSSGNVSAPPNPLIWNLYFFWPQSQMKRRYPVSKGILVQMWLFIHVFRILFTIIHSNTYLEKGLFLLTMKSILSKPQMQHTDSKVLKNLTLRMTFAFDYLTGWQALLVGCFFPSSTIVRH